MMKRTEYWLQQKRGLGDWFDYAEKPDLGKCWKSIEKYRKLQPESEFRCVIRNIEEFAANLPSESD